MLADVRTYIVEELSEGDVDPAQLDELTNLIEEDILDSLGIMSLVEFIEERYGLDIDPAEIEIENFETLAAITSLVAAKQAARAAHDA
ncbi:MAG TPA: acyl carrier protein [Acidimicrobiia bacterium]|nr:acyl carrier protein [Acidimicrobiia bacterium]